MSKRKVFAVGYAKTGTTTMKAILESLGYRVAGYNQFRHFAQQDRVTFEEVETHALTVMQDYDAAQDSPWPVLYKSLDRAFPGSRFIHVTRDPQAWLKSAVEDFGKDPNPLRDIIYGSRVSTGNEALWLDHYNRHNAAVRDYFEGRPQDYLPLSLERDLSVERICDFLGEPYTGQTVPVVNTRVGKRLKKLWWKIRR